jgi:hypothetical protein
VRLRTSLRTELEVDVVGRLLRAGGPDRWLGDSVEGGPSDMRRYATDLQMSRQPLARRLPLRKAAFVDVGPVERVAENLRVEVSWRSASLAPLFPVFSGWLTVRPDEIVIDGRYVPPGGPLGFVADRVLMHRAARYTAEWLLRELARAAAASATSVAPSSRTE